jgi:hypothetical protein
MLVHISSSDLQPVEKTHYGHWLLVDDRLHATTSVKRDQLGVKTGGKGCAEDLNTFGIDIKFRWNGDKAGSESTRKASPGRKISI